ncbi:MAG: hypothetical protein KAJ20_00300, partial [Candidatus Aenigmarchaeota archaeon]|nr:hypothetical protein [Candidatus Aenigmarchaeota archaeon]
MPKKVSVPHKKPQKHPEDMKKVLSELHLVLSKNKKVVELMDKKFVLDIKHEKVMKERDDMYKDLMVNYKTLKNGMDEYEKKFTRIIHLLRILSDEIKDDVRINRNEMDEKISDI